jgi:hypothetical protein
MISEQMKALREIVELIETLQKQPDFLHKDEIEQYLRWSGKHLADNIWQMTVNNKPMRD